MLTKESELLIVMANPSDASGSTIPNSAKRPKDTNYTWRFLDAHSAESYISQSKNGANQLFLFTSDESVPTQTDAETMVAELMSGEDLVVAGSAEQSLKAKILHLGGTFLSMLLFRSGGLDRSFVMVKREVLEKVGFPVSGAEVVIKARSAGYRVGRVDLPGKTANVSISGFVRFAKLLLRLKARSVEVAKFGPRYGEDKGYGFFFKSREYRLYNGPAYGESAFVRVSYRQGFTLAFLGAAIVGALLYDWKGTLIALIAVLTTIYFLDLIFNLFLIYRSFRIDPEIKISEKELGVAREWPSYTVFCPLYKEWQVLPQFVEAVSRLDYPKDRLHVILLLEENDQRTIEVARQQALPSFIQTVIVPDSLPKTKPKACNYGLRYATGEYSVIFDAEDMPEPDQLKKAVLAFERTGKDTVCMQAKLNFYNPGQNLLTKIFTAEYSLWFDLVLPGLQSINAPLPLGGTSNHFRTSDLRRLGGWDAFNVTEDCDLGMRLAKQGYKTAIFNSTTWEEANSRTRNWFRQRSRWIKGYIQTYLVHLRSWPLRQKNGLRNLLFFQLTVGGKVTSIFINPVMWFVTALYFAFRSQLGPTIEQFFPGPILYMGVFSFVFGNFLYLYYYMVGCARRGFDGLIKYSFLVPFYWIGMSIAAWKAFYEMAVKPHYWAKTIHGFHLPGQSEPVSEQVKEGPDAPQVLREPLPQRAERRKVQGGALLFTAFFAAGIVNLAFNVYLGRVLSLENFGVLNLFNSLFIFISVLAAALTVTVNHRVAYVLGERGSASAENFFRFIRGKGARLGIVLSVLWVLAIPVFSRFFDLSDYFLAGAFSLVPLIGLTTAAYRGYLQGVSRFAFLALVVFLEPVIKTAAAVVLIGKGLEEWTALSLPISLAAALFLLWLFVVRGAEGGAGDEKVTYTFPRKFFAAALLTGLSSTVFLNIDVLLSKHYLSAAEAGSYSLLSLAGKLIFYAGSLFTIFIMTEVSQKKGERGSTSKVFAKLLLGTAAVAGGGLVALSVFGPQILTWAFKSKADSISPLLTYYAAGITAFTIANAFVVYHMAREKLAFSLVAIASGAILAAQIARSHGSLKDFTEAVSWSGLLFFGLILLLHALSGYGSVVKRSVSEIRRLFAPLAFLPARTKTEGQKILIYNWRDTRHEFAGGAEIFVHELSKRWVELGHKVVLFCGNDGKSLSEEEVDGVAVIRRGGFYLVYLWAFVYYLLRFRGRFDMIIDCQNGVPFFTPLYANEPVVCLMHHVHQQVFMKYLKQPLSWLAKFLENTAMPLAYRNIRFLTVSESSKKEMTELGLGRAGIQVVNPGVDLATMNSDGRVPAKHPLVVFVGRLKPYKSVDVLIRAFVGILERVPAAELAVIGGGEDDARLSRLVEELGLAGKVRFTGKVSDAEKTGWLKRAWVAVNPSMMEGWGITTIEANACGVPVVASRVPGLIDSIKNPHTGYLFRYGDVAELTEKVTKILLSPKLRERMGREAVRWARNFDWDDIAVKALIAFTDAVSEGYPQKLSTKIYEKRKLDPIG